VVSPGRLLPCARNEQDKQQHVVCTILGELDWKESASGGTPQMIENGSVSVESRMRRSLASLARSREQDTELNGLVNAPRTRHLGAALHLIEAAAELQIGPSPCVLCPDGRGDHPTAIDVGHLQGHDLRDTESGGAGRHEDGAIFMMAQAAGDLGTAVRRRNCDESMGEAAGETASDRQGSVTGACTSCGRAPQHLPRSGLVQRRLSFTEVDRSPFGRMIGDCPASGDRSKIR
jgi:hypothetical protein